MRHLLAGLLVLVTFAGVSGGVRAQSAEAYFHQAAQAYIAKDIPRAKAKITAGLRLDPSNRKLRALRKKLRQQRRQSRQGSKGSDANRPSGDKGDQQNRQSEGPEDDRPPRDESAGEKKGDSSDAESTIRPKPSPAPSSSEVRAGSSSVAQEPREMSRARAARILQALERQEAQLLRQVRQREQPSRRVEKDW